MTQTRLPRYTDEVAAAMAAQGLTTPAVPEAPLPAGHIRYFAAVGTSQISGSGTPDQAAALLRALADQITSTPVEGAEHG